MLIVSVDPPGPPTTPDITDITSSAISLRWKPPQKDGGSQVTGTIQDCAQHVLNLKTLNVFYICLKYKLIYCIIICINVNQVVCREKNLARNVCYVLAVNFIQATLLRSE